MPRGSGESLFTKLRATRGCEVGRVHYYTHIRAVIYGYARHLFGAQVCERRCGEGTALKGRGKGGARGREKRFMSARRKTFVCI
jgi:hypothetical protein